MRSILSINFDRFKGLKVPANFGPAAQLQWLAIADLDVDDSYQRAIAAQGERNVRIIVERFDWRKFAPVVVSPIAGGRYAIVDGQHRTTAATLCGHASIPCAIIMADRQAQAESFAAINGTVTQVSRQQQFKAALTAGDPEALRINAVAKSAGVRILYSNHSASQLGVHETCAIDAIRKMLARHNEAIVITGLCAVVASAHDIGGYLKAQIIVGVCEAFGANRAWLSDARVIPIFSSMDLDAMHRQAISMAFAQAGLRANALFEAAIVTRVSKMLDVADAA